MFSYSRDVASYDACDLLFKKHVSDVVKRQLVYYYVSSYNKFL